MHMDLIGIDFGARTAGTTVVCSREDSIFRFQRCNKGKDADAWLDDTVKALQPDAIYIDAPLSLPGAYFGRGSDHFFRQADRIAGGMSPMFLGGLTARAIRLAEQWRAAGISVMEVYPGAHIRQEWGTLDIPSGKTIPHDTLRVMAGTFELPPPEPDDRHAADAWLCWLIGHRHRQGTAHVAGDPVEGVILF